MQVSWCEEISVFSGSAKSEWDLRRFETLASKAVWAFCWWARVPFLFLGIVQMDSGGWFSESIWLQFQSTCINPYSGNSAISWHIFINLVAFADHLIYSKQILVCSIFPIASWWTRHSSYSTCTMMYSTILIYRMNTGSS